ncbi:aldolase [Janthinobacterium agaricidamnosum]|uniref:Class II Aldolase and Adducin N-terminal domain protein n=1 Tax=Janthinobacterium agaricidamnosum NBRC 102515 = DSM 9628 TaxID=1349767 RepID=W0VE89_9BURK|nr:aldolase [Janthinobacterium agaricidamnosum]CDG86000.1 class II Aldolase and Adducin N-terminal domain protein [Janthinobacterium agaricidamnosum NBRC 102515 = DSM 9628]
MAHTYTIDTPASAIPARRLDSDAIQQARIELAACFQMAARHGYAEGICNHFSALVPGHPDLFLVNPYGYAFEELTASQLLVCDFDGHVLAGEGRPEATAFYIHARLHQLKPAVNAALHTHMPNATALSMIEDEPFLWLGQTALKFYGRIAVDRQYNGLALDNREGERIAQALGDADIVFMKNHGVMVTGPSIAEAWDDLYYLERAAEVQIRAMSTGRELVRIAPEVALLAHRQMRAGDPASGRAHMDSLLRILRRERPRFEE